MKIYITFILLFLTVYQSKSQNSDFLIRKDLKQYRNLYKLDYTTKNVSIIYKTEKSFISKIKISPNNKFISLIEIEEGTLKKENEWVYSYDIPPKNSLTILDPLGNIFMNINDDVRKYVWSPDGMQIAYITGTYYEGGIGFMPTGIYILNLLTKEKTKIENVTYPRDLHWLKTDYENSIYIKAITQEPAKCILKYNIRKKRLEITHVKGIHFSPDGKYYIMYPYETIDGGICDHPPKQGTTCFRVFSGKTNQVISEFSSKSMGTTVGWVYGQGHFLMFTKQEFNYYTKTATRGNKSYTAKLKKGVKKAENFIYDVEIKKLVQQFEGKVTTPDMWGEWIGTKDFLVVEQLEQSNQKTTNKENEIIIKKIPVKYRVR